MTNRQMRDHGIQLKSLDFLEGESDISLFKQMGYFMEIMEEFMELTIELAKLAKGLSVKKFKDNKDEIHGILEHMVELFDQLDTAIEDDELDELDE